MGGKIYYGAPSPEECKEAAMAFRQTKDEKLFWKFLHRFELLGHYVCRWMRQRNGWLRRVEIVDQEQTSYIGIYKAFTTIKPEDRPEYIYRRVISYVKHELTTTYHYLMDEYRYYHKLAVPDYMAAWSCDEAESIETATYTPGESSANLFDYKTCPAITDREADIIQMIYGEELTLTEAAARLSVSVPRIHQIVSRIHAKLRKTIKL